MDDEMAVLLDFLTGKLSKAGDGGNFKKSAWTAAASHITSEFPVMKGGVKDADTCERRFQLVNIVSIQSIFIHY